MMSRVTKQESSGESKLTRTSLRFKCDRIKKGGGLRKVDHRRS